MNHDFCVGCTLNSGLPCCTVGLTPGNAYIENIINNEPLTMVENFICHKAAQDFSGTKLSILSRCDDCGLCQITCPNIRVDYTIQPFSQQI